MCPAAGRGLFNKTSCRRYRFLMVVHTADTRLCNRGIRSLSIDLQAKPSNRCGRVRRRRRAVFGLPECADGTRLHREPDHGRAVAGAHSELRATDPHRGTPEGCNSPKSRLEQYPTTVTGPVLHDPFPSDPLDAPHCRRRWRLRLRPPRAFGAAVGCAL